jgi:hypothetical protein
MKLVVLTISHGSKDLMSCVKSVFNTLYRRQGKQFTYHHIILDDNPVKLDSFPPNTTVIIGDEGDEDSNRLRLLEEASIHSPDSIIWIKCNEIMDKNFIEEKSLGELSSISK